MISESGQLKASKLGDSIGGGTNKELMAEARMALSGNWGMGVAGYVLYFILVMSVGLFACSAVFFVTAVSAASGANAKLAADAVSTGAQVVQFLLSGAFVVGFCSYFLVLAQSGEARLECLFTGFKRFWRSFGVYVLSTLFVFLWMLLLIIPGIIAAFRYAMVYFIIADDADVGPLEAIRQSKMMMTGNKWKFFCLHWRFFGWWVLCLFTGGIGFLWLVPYMQTTFAKFYEDVK
ncbi:MAG: DUF975 family protein [Kiritimatiellales bacterium]|nr:DUF975 family protein [Kiritimatiellales bacterium]